MNLDFQKKISFIDLGLHIDVFINESYSGFVGRAGFFYARKYQSAV